MPRLCLRGVSMY